MIIKGLVGALKQIKQRFNYFKLLEKNLNLKTKWNQRKCGLLSQNIVEEELTFIKLGDRRKNKCVCYSSTHKRAKCP